ncbi:MAG: phage portal protein [Eubacteriales bacterium]
MLTQAEVIQFINEDKSTKKKLDAKKGLDYYEAEHDIKHYKLYYVDDDGVLQEDKNRSNIKIAHPFFTELVDQEVQYMLSGHENIVKSDDGLLQKELDKYFDDAFKSELAECLTGTVVKGFEHMYAYKSVNGRTKFITADSMGVVEVRAKDTDDGCEYVIYWYTDRIEKGHKKIKRIQVWDENYTYYYVQSEDGELEPDESEEVNPRPHIIYTKGEEETLYCEGNGGYGFIPFFRLDNNKKQQSGLKTVKDIIDDYDLMSCGLSNNLQDISEGIYVVKGFTGHNMDELIQNVKVKKHIGVDSDGDVDIKTIDIPYEARKIKLELDEKNIYRFGMGFNSAQLGDGNITNIVIKSRYALLDLKCNKLEIKLKQFLRKIIGVVLKEINEENDTDYNQENVQFNFKREIMTNAQDNAEIKKTEAETEQTLINTLLSLVNTFGDEIILKAICDALDWDYEEIKDKIPMDGETDTQKAQEMLGSLTQEVTT